MSDDIEPLAEGVPRLEAMRLRDLLAEAGVPTILQPDGGTDLGRATDVLVPSRRADFARRVIAEAEAGEEWVPDDSPHGLLARISEHLDALRGLVDELARRLDDLEAATDDDDDDEDDDNPTDEEE